MLLLCGVYKSVNLKRNVFRINVITFTISYRFRGPKINGVNHKHDDSQAFSWLMISSHMALCQRRVHEIIA